MLVLVAVAALLIDAFTSFRWAVRSLDAPA
jgi:hypothetical protein